MKRRHFLKRLGLGAGTTLLSAPLGSWLREARGQMANNKRLVVYANSNGFIPASYEGVRRSETDFDLGEALAPLSEWKNRLMIVDALDNPHIRDLHGSMYATLTVMPGGNNKVGGTGLSTPYPGGPSIDRVIAKKIGAEDPFASTAVGLRESLANTIHSLSADGKDQFYPAIGNPVKAYETYFGSAVNIPGGYDATRAMAQDRSLLDYVTQDIARLNGSLAAAERQKLQRYTESLRGLELQLSRLATRRACTVAQRPTVNPTADRLAPEILRAHMDVTYAALACGLTHVSHVSALGSGSPHDAYSWLGDKLGQHNQHHENNLPMIKKIDAFHFGEIAHLWRRLSDTPEAGGTMADSALIMYVNSAGMSHHSGGDRHAVVLLGNPGQYFRSGRFVRFPKGQRCVSDLYTSVANAMGVPLATFGSLAHSKGELPGLR